MQYFNTARIGTLRFSGLGFLQPHFKAISVAFNRKSTYRYKPIDKRECFDINNVFIVRGNESHATMITSFLNAQYWPREPSVVALWMPLNSPYLEFLTARFSYTGERLLAMERQQRTGQCKMVGLTVANRVYPWMISELEQWGHVTDSKPERSRMYFCAHCLKSPNLFKKYNVDYIYDIEVLGTTSEVTGHGVGTLLLNAALDSAKDMRHPLVQVLSVSKYSSKICERCGMTRAWSMQYSDYVDKCGQSVFYPRSPHHTVSVYVKPFEKCSPRF